MKTNFITFKISPGSYWAKKRNDEYLETIGRILTDGITFVGMLYKYLQDPNFRGTAGNEVRIEIEDQIAIVTWDLFWDSDDLFEAKIHRDALFRLIQRWLIITKNKPDLIIMKQENDGEITCIGRLDTTRNHRQRIIADTKFAILENIGDWYLINRYSDQYLYSLLSVVLQETEFIEALKKELINPAISTLQGNLNVFNLQKDTVTIDLIDKTILENAQWCIEISRHALAELLTDWQKINTDKPEIITAILENNKINLTVSHKQEPLKSNFISLHFRNDRYLKGNEYNKYLSTLVNFIMYQDFDWTKKQLQNPESTGAPGYITNASFNNDLVTIKCFYLDDYDEPTIEIDRTALLNLILRWEEVVKDKPDIITMTLKDDGEINVVGAFTTQQNA